MSLNEIPKETLLAVESCLHIKINFIRIFSFFLFLDAAHSLALVWLIEDCVPGYLYWFWLLYLDFLLYCIWNIVFWVQYISFGYCLLITIFLGYCIWSNVFLGILRYCVCVLFLEYCVSRYSISFGYCIRVLYL